MRSVRTHYLSDGKLFNDGRPAVLIEVDGPGDLDALHRRIIDAGYYDSDFFVRHSGYQGGQLISHFFFVAELVRHLRPRRVIEAGCGRGDVLYLLSLAGVEVAGIDFSEDVFAQAWPSLRSRLSFGDLRDVLIELGQAPTRFDVLCGFDIWEHLPPHRLGDYLDAMVGVGTEDAFFVSVMPAFGEDPVFGEKFPLEFEENRDAHEGGRPYRYLLADANVPEVPALGHLIWAPSAWWERTFAEHGLIRLPELERPLHHFFDPFLPRSVQAFFVLRRDTPEAAARAARLAAAPYGRRDFTRTMLHLARLRRGPDGPVRFDTDLRPRVFESWRSRLGLLARDRWGRIRERARPG